MHCSSECVLVSSLPLIRTLLIDSQVVVLGVEPVSMVHRACDPQLSIPNLRLAALG
jgi:hypothetical protein